MVRCSINSILKTYWMTWEAVVARVMNRNDCKGSQSTEFNELLRSLYASWAADSHHLLLLLLLQTTTFIVIRFQWYYWRLSWATFYCVGERVSSGGWYCYSCVSPGVLNWIWLLLKLYWHTWSLRDTVLYTQLSYIYSPGTSVLLSCHSRSSITTAAGVTSHNRMKSEPPPPPHVCTTLLWQTTTT